jgi:AcrR family transcriptional regulator
MKPSREPYHHGDLKNALVSAAVKHIERHGQATFSLREAARDVGVSANAAYRHFDDKAALLLAASAHGFDLLGKHMLQAMVASSHECSDERASVRAFKAIGRAYIEFAAAKPALFQLMFGESGIGCLTSSQAQSSPVSPWNLLGQSLDALVADKVLSPEMRLGAEMKAWAVVHGFSSLAPSTHATKTKATIEALLDFTVVGLCGTFKPARRKMNRRS